MSRGLPKTRGGEAKRERRRKKLDDGRRQTPPLATTPKLSLFIRRPPFSHLDVFKKKKKQIWVPAVILGNLIGVLIFLYAHEASTHQISGAFRRWFCGGGGDGDQKKKKVGAASAAAASSSPAKEAAEGEPSSFQAPSSSSLRRKIPLQDSAHPSPYRPGSLAATPSRAKGSTGNGGGGITNPLSSPGEFNHALGSAAAAAAAAASSLRARPLPASYEADSFLSEGDEEDEQSRNGGSSEAGSFDSADFEDDDDEAGLLSTAWVRSCACGGKGAAAVKGGPAGGSWCNCRVRWVPPPSAAFSSSGLENGALRASSPDASPSFARNGDKKAAGSVKKSSRSSARCPRPIEISWSNVTCNLTHVPPSSDPDDVAAAAIDEAAAAARNGGSGSGSNGGGSGGGSGSGGKPVLGPNWGEVLPGEMCAIVGPSGAGKSTLLDVLAARKTVGVVGGTVSVGGRAVPASSHSRGGKGGGKGVGGGGGSASSSSSASAAALAEAALFFRKVAAYVPQEDAYVPTLTAAETLTFHARLRARRRGGIIRGGDGDESSNGGGGESSRAATCCLSGSSPANDPAAIAALVREGLSQVGLSRAGATAVGGTLPLGLVVRGLSSGERRRLSVACALVGSPSLLLLDEPTTGLDAAAALAVTRRLASLARAGHTVIATIHQVSFLKLFY